MDLSPHIALPSAREVPAAVLRALREKSPRAELVYAGQGEWWLGEVREDVPRAVEGRQKLARLRTRGGRLTAWRQARCMAQGFGVLEVLHGDPQAAWADRLDRYLHVSEQSIDASAEHALANAEGADIAARRSANLRAFAQQEGRSIHRHARRKADGLAAHTVPAPIGAAAPGVTP